MAQYKRWALNGTITHPAFAHFLIHFATPALQMKFFTVFLLAGLLIAAYAQDHESGEHEFAASSGEGEESYDESAQEAQPADAEIVHDESASGESGEGVVQAAVGEEEHQAEAEAVGPEGEHAEIAPADSYDEFDRHHHDHNSGEVVVGHHHHHPGRPCRHRHVHVEPRHRFFTTKWLKCDCCGPAKKGFAVGFAKGQNAGYHHGFHHGKHHGVRFGLCKGRKIGYHHGLFDGKRRGYVVGMVHGARRGHHRGVILGKRIGLRHGLRKGWCAGKRTGLAHGFAAGIRKGHCNCARKMAAIRRRCHRHHGHHHGHFDHEHDHHFGYHK